LTAEGDCGISSLLVPSPQSEAVTHEMEELSLSPRQTGSVPPVESEVRRNVLQLRLQQRRTREQLVDQGIMPPLKSPAAFHGQIRSLERARTENFLKHKIRSRPERAELVRMHILQETGAEPSLQATQMKLKRARLADNLNEKIAQRPGPMELVEKNILPVASSLKEAIIVGQVNYPKVLEEDGCYDAVSPEQPASQESQGSAPSPGESRVPETPPTGPAPAVLPAIAMLQPLPGADFPKPASANEQPLTCPPVQHAPPTAAPSKPGPTLVKQSQQKSLSEKSRSKKGKEAKSRVKKLKYHQYVPPDQKQDAGEPPMDSSYVKIIQNLQITLLLYFLQQSQQKNYNYQTILPASLKPVAESQSSGVGALPASIVVSLPTAPPQPLAPPAPPRPNNLLANRKPGVLPANLDEMKVAELKLELKLRGLPVSGTKTDLIERLKPFQENSSLPAPPGVPTCTAASSMPMEVSSSAAPAVVLPVQQAAPERMCSTPPNSPIPSDPAALLPDVSMSEAEAQPGSGSGSPQPEERDRRLHEKQRQIEDLMRKLEREQRLVEELKMQLEVEKRGQADPVLSSGAVKMEGPVLSSCSSGTAVLSPQVVKLEDGQPAAPGLQQFFISHPAGVLGQPQTLLTAAGQTTTQIFVPVSLPNSGAIQLPNSGGAISLQPVLSAPSSGPGLVQNPLPQLQSANMEVSANQQAPLLQTLTLCSSPAALGNQNRSESSPQRFLQRSPESRASPHTSPNHQASNGPLSKVPTRTRPGLPLPLPPQQTFVLQPPREPPRYEDAVKQSRSLQAAGQSQVPTATSQHMDDLFDILVESGEIPPFLPQDAAGALTKTHPVTASITTLPVGSALSRSPPQVQLGPPVLDGQLEAFLERTLAETAPASDPRTQGLMEELRGQLADPFVPMDTTDLSFSDPAGSALGLALFDPNLDGMEWLDGPTTPGPAGFPAEFLEPHDMQLNFD
uniref:Myocardin related transcription factor Ba n=1 Tax=Poecilia formosa TaxID=48698 RepID=A0A096MFQ0_POEFO